MQFNAVAVALKFVQASARYSARNDCRENIRVTGATLHKVHLDKVSRISYDLSRKVAKRRLFIRHKVSYC